MMFKLILFIFFVNLSFSIAEWELDNYIEVENNGSKVLKSDNSYFILSKISNVLKFTRISSSSKETTILDSSFNYHLNDFDIDLNSIIYDDYANLYLYDFKENKFMESISKYPTFNISFHNNRIYSYSSILLTKSSKLKSNTLLQIYDLNRKSKDIYTFPDPVGIDLVCFAPNKNISIFDTLVAIHQISDYKIKFFDYNYTLIDSFSFVPNGWKQFNGVIPVYDGSQQMVEHIEKCYFIVDNYSQIMLLNTLNDSTLLISWRTGFNDDSNQEFQYVHDIWQKSNDDWEHKEQFTTEKDNEDKVLDFYNLKIWGSYYIKHGYLYIIKPFPTNLVKKYYEKSMTDFENEMNEYYIDNDLQYTCFIYKYVP